MKVLLLDTNVSSYPIYKALLEFGCEVFVAGNNPDDCLAGISDNYISLDYSSIEETQKIQVQENFDAIIPGCNDVSYKTASALNAINNFGLNLDSIEINDQINDKGLFKKLALSLGISVSKPLNDGEINLEINEKIIVKPVDSYSGKGITIIDNENLHFLKNAIDRAKANSQKGEYLIEEFFDGQLYSHSAFIKNGKIEIDFIVEEHCIVNPFAVDTSWLIKTEDFFLTEKIREEINKLVIHFKLCDGLIHTQFLAKEDNFIVLEITRRCPGDSYSLLVEHSTTFKYARNYVAIILKQIQPNSEAIKYRNIFRQTVFIEECYYISHKPQIQYNLVEIIPHVKTGTNIKSYSNKRIAVLFGEYGDKLEIGSLRKLSSN